MVAKRYETYQVGANTWYEVVVANSQQASVPVTDHSSAMWSFLRDDVALSEWETGPNPLNQALEPMALSREEADELRAFLAHPTAFPAEPPRRIPEGDKSRLERLR